MITNLENNPIVCITSQTDAICSKCPHNLQGICEAEKKVTGYDTEVLKRCGFKNGAVMPYLDFKKEVYEKILLLSKREEICGNCQWNELCRF